MSGGVQYRAAARLGRRSFAAGEDRLALAVVFAITLLSSFVLAAIVIAVPIGQAQEHRRLDVAPVSQANWTGLRVGMSFLDLGDEFSIERLSVSAEAGANVHVPGLQRPPRVGEVWASPGLVRLAKTYPELRDLWPRGLAGEIGREGLTSPNHLRLYQGVEPSTLATAGFEPRDSFGNSQFAVPSEREQARSAALFSVVLFAVIPLFALAAAAFRQLSTLRRARERRLGALGMKAGASTLASTFDGLIVTVVGSIVGVAGAVVAATHANRVPGLPASWWPSDVPMRWDAFALIVLAHVVWAALVLRVRSRLRKVRTQQNERGRWAVVVLALGVCAVLATHGMRVDESDAAVAAIAAAMLAVGAGLLGSIPWLVRQLGRRLLVGASQETSRIAGARLVRGAAATRGAGMLIVLIALAGTAAAPLVGQVSPTDTRTPAANQSMGRVLAEITGVPGGTNLQALLGPEADVSVASISGQRREFRFTCDQLKRLGLTDCPRELVQVGSLPTNVVMTFPTPSNAFLAVGPPNVIAVSPTEADLSGSRGAPAIVMLPTEPEAIRRAQIAVAALPGAANLYPWNGGLIGGPDQRFRVVQDWLRIALGGCLIIGVLLALLGLLEDARSRRRTDSSLVMLGVGPRQTRRAHRIEVSVRMGTLALLTGSVCALLAGSIASWSGIDHAPTGWMTTLFGGLALLAATSVAVAPTMVDLRDPVEAMRRD